MAQNPFFAGASKTWGPLAPKPPKAPANPFFAQAAGKPWNAGITAAAAQNVAPAPAAAAPGQAPGTSATSTGAGSPSGGLPPLDSTALANIAANQFKVNNQVNGLNLQSTNDTQALQTALANLAYQQPRDQLKLEQGANSRGALYSTAYDQGLGDLNHGYLVRQSSATDQNGRQQASIAAQIQALLGGEPLFNQGQESASAARLIAAAQRDSSVGQAGLPAAPAAAPAVAPAPAASRTIQDGGFGKPPKAAAKPNRGRTIQSGSWRGA